jgi:hypothetical protein
MALTFSSALRADDRSELLAKQKAAAEENWKKMEFGKSASSAETPNFLIYARLPEAKTKTLGAALEKLFATAGKALKFDDKERPWPGKLVVYVVPERGDFASLMRKVVKKSPGEDDASFSEVRGDDAILVVGAPKADQVDAEEQAKMELTTMLLKRKMGAGEPPPWVQIGFAKASVYRAATKAKPPVRAPAGVPLNYMWAEGGNAKIVANYATYVIDYMAYGPIADSFATFVAALRPGEGGTAPSMNDALASIKMTEATLEYCARRWIKPSKGKNPPKKPNHQ